MLADIKNICLNSFLSLTITIVNRHIQFLPTYHLTNPTHWPDDNLEGIEYDHFHLSYQRQLGDDASIYLLSHYDVPSTCLNTVCQYLHIEFGHPI